MRKFVFNGAVIGSLVGVWSIVKATKDGPRDWRLVLTWLSWGLSLAVAIVSVVDESKQAEISEKSR